MNLDRHIRPIPDFPKPGILFRDITPLLADAGAFSAAIQALAEPWRSAGVMAIAAVEARGFLFAGPLALELGVGVIPVRKPGKLPRATPTASYALEYGTDTLHMHQDAVPRGARVLAVDDLLATGGTLKACCELVERSGATVGGTTVLIELAALGGRKVLAPHSVHAVIRY